jgi:alpha-amylase
MVSVCFYFQVHQPFRLQKFQVFHIGTQKNYFDDQKNKDILLKVAGKCYLPMNKLLLELIKNNPDFKVSFSFSGVFLEQCEKYYPEILLSFKDLVSTGQVEILAETYHHSLSFLYSEKEFEQQVNLHQKKIKQLFNVTPTVFRNTELIYSNALAMKIEKMGFKAVLLEGWDPILQWRSPNFVYKPVTCNIPLLLKNYKLSDDVAFRFSNKSWEEHPLSVEKYTNWINQINGNGETVNLFMDYETFGEHQWESTGIFEFMRYLPAAILSNPDNNFKFPSEIAASYPQRGELDIHNPISWADLERDVSAWLGNDMQRSSISKLYELEEEIKLSGDDKLISDWRKLQTSDHFYYMCTKWFSDGDVHKYFNPYDTPYEGFIYFMNIYKDIKYRLQKIKEGDKIDGKKIFAF